jgi:hypothetical protein
MTQQGFSAVPPRFSIGGVVGASLSLLRRNFWQFFAIAFVLGLPVLVLSLVLSQITVTAPGGPVAAPGGAAGAPAGAVEAQMPFAPPDAAGALASTVGVFVLVLTYFMIQSAINLGTLQLLRGEKPAVGPCIARGLALLPRLFVAALLLFLAIIGLAFVAALVAYGIAMVLSATTGLAPTMAAVSTAAGLGMFGLSMVVLVGWWVFVPAMVAENVGPLAAFRRSRWLTKGHRWSILGIIVLVFIANLASALVIGAVGQFAVATAALLNVAVGLAFSALSSVLTAIGYTTLRAEKEGSGPGEPPRIFA